MKLANLASILLMLVLVSICESRPLSDRDKKKLQKEAPKWKAPKIDEFVSGNLSKKGPVYTYEFQYKNTEESKVCDVTLKEKMKADGTSETQHKWKCKTNLPDDPDYQGTDFNRHRRTLRG